jgi:hypothetical protein
MPEGHWTVAACPFCDALHPVHFDGYVGVDGDDVFVCPEAGRIELSDIRTQLFEVVVVSAENGSR